MLYVNPMEANPLLRTQSAVTQPQRQDIALKEFERVFLYQLLKEIRKTVPENTLFPKGPQEQLYDEMMDDFLAGKMVDSGQIGIAKQMSEQLKNNKLVQPGEVGQPYREGIRIRVDEAGYSIKTKSFPLSHETEAGKSLKLKAQNGLRL